MSCNCSTNCNCENSSILPIGPTGATGLSAYEIAVEEGFVGNEAAWLASLVGDTGPEGPQGDPGADGDDQFFITSLTLTPGQIQILNGTPIPIVSAVASRKIEVIAASVDISGGTVAYSGNSIIQVISATATAAQFELDCLALAVGSNFSFKLAQVTASPYTDASGQLAMNQALLLKVKTGNPAASGDRVVTVNIVYKLTV